MKKHILIYGATGAIGSETARRLRAEGCSLHLVGRREDALADLAKELDAGCTAGDAADTELFARAADAAGTCDGLIYAVGTINLGSISRLSEEDFIADFRVNAAGAALAVQAALPLLKKSTSDPAIVLYSSVAVEQGFPMHASMGMAKGAVSGLTLSLAAELAPRIRVNAVAPSLTRTPLAEGLLANDKLAEKMAASHALRRLGEAGDIAAITVFLLSEQASWITGQIIGVDGGRSNLRTGA